MSRSTSSSRGFRAPPSDWQVQHPQSPESPQKRPMDLVTFLEAASAILYENQWLDFLVINALDSTQLPDGQGYTFAVRRHILGQRIYANNGFRLVPGNVVILKVARGFQNGIAVEDDNISSDVMESFIREMQVLTNRRLRDTPEVINLLRLVWETEEGAIRPVLMLEYANCGTLDAFIESGRARSCEVKASLCRDVLKGLSALHEVGVVHGDVKCANVLVFEDSSRNSDGSRDVKFKAKLSDFGFSIFLAEHEPGAQISVRGTRPYMAPEATAPVEGDHLIFTDYFSFGMIVWQVLSNGKPGNDLFCQDPFRPSSRGNSINNWNAYVESEKKSHGFANKVKESVQHVSCKLDGCPWEEKFRSVLDSTLQPDAARRNIAADALDKYGHEQDPQRPDWSASPAVLRPLPDAVALDLRQFSSPHPAFRAQIVSSLEHVRGTAGDQRATEALFILSQCYINGFGTRQSDERGLFCLREAANLGHGVAQLVLPRVTAAVEAEHNDDAQGDDEPDHLHPLVLQGSQLRYTSGLDQYPCLCEEGFPDPVDQKNILGETPLICAARNGHKACVETLIELGAAVDCVSFTGQTALHWLVSFPDADIAAMGALLFSHISLVSYALTCEQTPTTAATGMVIRNGTPLHWAVALRRRSVVQFLLGYGADPFFTGIDLFYMDAIDEAGTAGRHYTKPDPQYRNVAPIHIACQAHDAKMLELLLDNRSLVDDLPKMNVESLVSKDALFTRSLLGHACNPISRFSRMAIHGKRQKQALRQTFELLLSKPGQNLHSVDMRGKSALLTSCEANDTELILHILSLPDSTDTLEKTFLGGWGTKPLHVAVELNNVEAARALLKAGANALAERSDGTTALLACAANFLPDREICKLLLDKEPRLVSMESYSDTPFSAALRNHDLDCARLLLARGADPNQPVGPRALCTAFYQILVADYDISAVKFLLTLDNISFVVSPQRMYTALHAPFHGMLRYHFYDRFKTLGPCNVFDELLKKWNSKDDLEAREIRGYAALHLACISRDVDVLERILDAMRVAGANVNLMSDFLGSPINETPLDVLEAGSTVPTAVSKRGPAAEEEYNKITETLRKKLISAGGKRSSEVLCEVWSDLSFMDRLKATLRANRATRVFVLIMHYLYGAWLIPPGAFTNHIVAWTQTNANEIQYNRARRSVALLPLVRNYLAWVSNSI